jgi:hypothetical protein
LCSEIRRIGDAEPDTIRCIAELWAAEPRTIVPLLQSLRSCGIVEGTRFRRDVWGRAGMIPQTIVEYVPLLPNQEIKAERRKADERARYHRRQAEIRLKKEEKEHDIYCMAGI